VPVFGYKNHVGIDREHGFVRRYSVTHGAAWDGGQLARCSIATTPPVMCVNLMPIGLRVIDYHLGYARLSCVGLSTLRFHLASKVVCKYFHIEFTAHGC
jgi:hypothetical protein